MLATPPPRSLLCKSVRRREVNPNRYDMGKRILESEVEPLKTGKLKVQKRKKLTTHFAGLFLAHSRRLRLFSLPGRDMKFGCGQEDLSVFLYVFEVLFCLKACHVKPGKNPETYKYHPR
jgi:hypothetical protein